MADGSPPVRTIHSASNEAPAMTERSKAHSIRSGSDEGANRADGPDAAQSQDKSARPFDRAASQAGREFVEQAVNRPAQEFTDGGELAGRTVKRISRDAAQNLKLAMTFGNAMASIYGIACSEIVNHMHQAAQRQSEFMNEMLRARGPGDFLLAGNRYLLGGLQGILDTNVRIAQASANQDDDANQKRGQFAA